MMGSKKFAFPSYKTASIKYWIVAMLVITAVISSCATIDAADSEAPMDEVTIEGKISVKGSGRNTYLCLSTDTGVDYRLEGSLKETIWNRYQQEVVVLEGVIGKESLGPGFPAEFIVNRMITKE